MSTAARMSFHAKRRGKKSFTAINRERRSKAKNYPDWKNAGLSSIFSKRNVIYGQMES